ncbi:M3 family metallopeptidase [Deinococcus roseus]|uniref:Oligoendopeptidase F n=1 Tax=Deinococcus roseus TaxID=392414 RepID=A0ABQ2CZP3_9DEIO|nr:M3 family metallopeptidase [Deinococcus roseus]GGJ35268.1 oligoendopeptidase F [Deinococcus roseus]
MFKEQFTYDWPNQQNAWQELLDFPLNPETRDEWLAKWDELERHYAEQRSRLHWDTMADVKSPEPLEAYKAFNRDVVPQVTDFQKEIYARWVEFDLKQVTPGWEVTTRYLKHLQREQDLIPELLQQEEEKMMEFYNASHVEQPVPAPYATEQDLLDAMDLPDRQQRQAAWEARQIHMQPLREHRVARYFELIQLRWEQARKLGFNNPLELSWERLKRHDFTLQQWQETRTTLLNRVPALLDQVHAQVARELELPEFDWVDRGHPALSKISAAYDRTDLTALHAGLRKVFQAFSPRLAEQYQELLDGGYLDLEDRRTKTTQGFADLLAFTRKPCSMMTIDASAGGLTLLLHEMGHVQHFHEMLQVHPTMLLDASAKFMEFVAHTFEVYGAHFAAESEILTPENIRILRLLTLMYRLEGMLHCAMVDLWEEWVYTTPPESLTTEALYAHWEEIAWAHHPWLMSVPEAGRNYWTNGWHVRVPFGKTRYALADLCALEFSGQMIKDPHQAFERLTAGMRLGGTLPFLGLIQACGLEFDFTPQAVERSLQAFQELAAFWGLAAEKRTDPQASLA